MGRRCLLNITSLLKGTINMREVEVLVRVHDDFKKAQRLLKRHAKFEKKVEIHDVYLMDPLRKGLSPDEKGGLTEALRVRKMDDGDFLTHKIDHFNKLGEWTHSDEQEVGIASAPEMLVTFKRLGFLRLVTVDMERLYFKTPIYTITLECVQGLGLFLEVEAHPTEGREVPVVREEIKRFIKSLGFNTSEDVGIGKPELLLKKRMAEQKQK